MFSVVPVARRARKSSPGLPRVGWRKVKGDFGTICCPEAEGALPPVPEGPPDRNLARSAWGQRHLKRVRPVGYGLIRAGMRTDSMIGVISLKKTRHTF
jgi:hypothetical protein